VAGKSGRPFVFMKGAKMQLKFDVKMLVIGMILGLALAAVLGVDGAGSADADRFGIAVEKEGVAVIRDRGGDFFVLNTTTGMATRVLVQRRLGYDVDHSRDDNGRIFNYSQTRQIEETPRTPARGY
jgi:hypothetical protein